MKDFVHLCCNEGCVHDQIDGMWRVLQHYPQATVSHQARRIVVPEIMTHIFISHQRSQMIDEVIKKLRGVELCGWDTCGEPYPTALGRFLDSRVRV